MSFSEIQKVDRSGGGWATEVTNTMKMTMDAAMLPEQQKPRPMAKGGDNEGGSAAAEVLTVEGETF